MCLYELPPLKIDTQPFGLCYNPDGNNTRKESIRRLIISTHTVNVTVSTQVTQLLHEHTRTRRSRCVQTRLHDRSSSESGGPCVSQMLSSLLILRRLYYETEKTRPLRPRTRQHAVFLSVTDTWQRLVVVWGCWFHCATLFQHRVFLQVAACKKSICVQFTTTPFKLLIKKGILKAVPVAAVTLNYSLLT